MQDTVSAVGVVGTDPTLMLVGNGLARLTFRLGSTQRKFNREGSGWENGETNWYSVVAFRRLAENGAKSLSKGDRVVVTGRLRVNEWEREGRHGINVELLADGIGHDLMFGTTAYTKNSASSSSELPTTNVDPSTPSQQQDAPAVDADGWALPGVLSGSETTASANDSELTSADDGADAEEEQQLVFSDVEPPF